MDKAKETYLGTFDFGAALAWLKQGRKVQRAGWNGKGMWINLQVPDAHSKMSLPYVYMYTACKNLVPWLASQTDILAEDWSVFLTPDEQLQENKAMLTEEEQKAQQTKLDEQRAIYAAAMPELNKPAMKATLSLSDFWGLSKIVQDPAITALLADVKIDISNPATLADPVALRGELQHLADGFLAVSQAFPVAAPLAKAHDYLYKLQGYAATRVALDGKPVAKLSIDQALSDLKNSVTKSTTYQEAKNMAAKWVAGKLGLDWTTLGPILMAIVQLIARLLLGV